LQVVKQVAEQLGNTPTVCRKCYIHPAVLESYLDGALENLTALTEDHSPEMWAVEGEVIRFLDARLRNAAPRRTLKAALYA
jgi:DNA topoisomerase-1